MCISSGGDSKQSVKSSHLVLAALARLQAGQDLALDNLHPGISLLVRSGFEVPRLARQRHDGELKVLLLLCWRENREKTQDSEQEHSHGSSTWTSATCFTLISTEVVRVSLQDTSGGHLRDIMRDSFTLL